MAPKFLVSCAGFCPYCKMAIRLLESKDIAIERIRVDEQPARFSEMKRLRERRYGTADLRR